MVPWPANAIGDVFRYVFFVIDIVVNLLLNVAYDIFMVLAKYQLFSDSTELFNEVAKRLYAIIGIFMIFKIAISLVQMIADPSKFDNKENGFGKIVFNIVIVLILLSLTPTIFGEAYKIQRIILEEGIVQKLILGENSVNPTDIKVQFVDQIYGTFFYLEEYASGNGIGQVCGSGYEGINGIEGIDATEKIAVVKACEKFNEEGSLASFFQVINVKMKSSSESLVDTKKVYVFNYTPLFPTVLAGFIAFLFLTFTIDVAVRSVKLIFLQIIAPVPIISRITPDGAKKGTFSRWVNECVQTYLALFIRIGVVYLVLFLISTLGESFKTSSPFDSFEGAGWLKPFAFLFICIGLLLFANKAPKLIQDIFGIKDSIELNPMKKIGSSPLASAALGATIGGTASLASNAVNAGVYAKNNWKNAEGFTGKAALLGKIIPSSIAGGLTGAALGLASGAKNKDNFVKAGMGTVKKNNEMRNNNMKAAERRKSEVDENVNQEKINRYKKAMENRRTSGYGYSDADDLNDLIYGGKDQNGNVIEGEIDKVRRAHAGDANWTESRIELQAMENVLSDSSNGNIAPYENVKNEPISRTKYDFGNRAGSTIGKIGTRVSDFAGAKTSLSTTANDKRIDKELSRANLDVSRLTDAYKKETNATRRDEIYKDISNINDQIAKLNSQKSKKQGS